MGRVRGERNDSEGNLKHGWQTPNGAWKDGKFWKWRKREVGFEF